MEKRNELVWLVPPSDPDAKGAGGSWRIRSSWLPHEVRKGRNWEKTARDQQVAEQLLAARRAELLAYAAAAVKEAEERGVDVADVDAGYLTFGEIAREWFEHQQRAGHWGTSQTDAHPALAARKLATR